jgi:DNA-binding response OmpR family regulator
VALCERCGEEIALANDLDRAGDIDRRRHRVMVAGKPRSLTATHRQIFMLLYRHRGDVVSNYRIRAELSEWQDHPSTHPNNAAAPQGSLGRGTRSSIIGPRL